MANTAPTRKPSIPHRWWPERLERLRQEVPAGQEARLRKFATPNSAASRAGQLRIQFEDQGYRFRTSGVWVFGWWVEP